MISLEFHVAVRAALLVLCVVPALPALAMDRVEVAEVVEHGRERDEDHTIRYTLAVLNGTGWKKRDVDGAVRRVEAVFAGCGVTVLPRAVYWLDAPASFAELDEPMQTRLLATLPSTRPIALLVDRTTDRDVAYSYLPSAPVATRGTAWVTRNSHPACLAPLLAHELGHVLLDTPRHSNDPDNLMSPICTVSNLAGDRPGTRLNESQCAILRDR